MAGNRAWIGILPIGALLISFLFTSHCSAADWLRFRGPNGSGVSPDQEATPVTWSATENLKWKVELPGSGVSCPIVVGDKIFVTCYSGYGVSRNEAGSQEDLKRHLLCVDRTTGRTIWEKSFEAALPEDPYSGAGVPQHGYASHTPVSDGTSVYAFFGKSGVYAFDLDGKELWKASVGQESDPRQWGSSSSPIIAGKVLIVAAGPEARAIVGIDTATGKELWRADSEGLGNVWGSPAVAEIDEKRTDVVIGAPGEIWGLNPATGKLRWYCEALGSDQFSSSVVIQDGIVYAIEGRGAGSIAVKAGGKGDVTKTNVIWSGRDSSRFGTPIVYDGRMYFVSDTVMNCISAANGEKIYQSRFEGGSAPAGGRGAGGGRGDGSGGGRGDGSGGGRGEGGGRPGGGRQGGGGGMGGNYASLILADGKLYYTTRNGDMFVFKASDKFEQLAVNRVTDESEDFSATPAVSNGELFYRSNRHLYCVSAKK